MSLCILEEASVSMDTSRASCCASLVAAIFTIDLQLLGREISHKGLSKPWCKHGIAVQVAPHLTREECKGATTSRPCRPET